MDKLYQIFKTGLSLDAGGVAGYASATSSWPFHKAPNNLTDLEKLKQCLDDIGIEYDQSLGRDDITSILVKEENNHDIMYFQFRFNGSFFRTA